jgi:glycine/D-amino acid oxidase-like deaminating enzyme
MTAISLWHAIGGAYKERPPVGNAVDADLAIIGGGFAGLSTALHAATKGLSVVLLEAEIVAWGATGRNAGFVVPNFAKRDPDDILAELGTERGERLVRFAAGSADLVFGLIQRHAIDCQAEQSGWIQPAHSAAALTKVRSRAAQWSARGRPAEVMNAAETETALGAKGYPGSWTDRSGGLLDPVAYARGLAKAAEAAGARIFERSPVTAIARKGDGYQLTTAHGTVRAGKVFIATNAYGGNLEPALARSYIPLRVFQIATEPLPRSIRQRLLPANQSMSDTRRNLFTMRFDAENRLITGGMHIFSPGAESRVPRAIHRRLAEKLELRDLPPIAHGWSGMAAVEPDFLPHLVDLGPNILAGISCNGRGIALTTALGREIAEWATGTPASVLPIPFAPPREIPFHGLVKHAPNVMLPWSMLRDKLDERTVA